MRLKLLRINFEKLIFLAMAISASTAQREENTLDNLLHCILCSEPFDQGNHQAKLLPCLHTFCLSCLKANKWFECPNCHKTVLFPSQETVDSLPNNFLVDNLKAYRFKLNLPCGNCNNEMKGRDRFCHDCDTFLCESCVDAHRLSRRQHKVSTLSELQTKCNDGSVIQKCQKHPKQDLTLYCKLCKVPICQLCGLTNHKSHFLVDVEVASQETRNTLKQLSALIYHRNQNLLMIQKFAANKQSELLADAKKREENLKVCVQEVHRSVDSKYKQTYSYLKDLYKPKNNNVTKAANSIENLSTQMTTAWEFADIVCEISNPVQLLTSHNQVLNRLQELNNVDLPDINPDQIKPSVEAGLVMNRMQELRKSVDRFQPLHFSLNHDPDFRAVVAVVVVACFAFFWGFFLGLNRDFAFFDVQVHTYTNECASK